MMLLMMMRVMAMIKSKNLTAMTMMMIITGRKG